jgi:hypothetical protein
MGDIADKAALITDELPVLKQIKGVFGLAGAGIAAAAAYGPEEGTALPAQYIGEGGFASDPMASYNQGVMLRGLNEFSETIPELLKRRPELVAGMTMEESGIPGMAGIIDAIAASVAPPEETEEQRKREIVDVADTQFEVNELQARGLGYGGENIAKEANRQVSLLTEIRDVLKLASTDGTLNWT